jgi:hypothetical protein
MNGLDSDALQVVSMCSPGYLAGSTRLGATSSVKSWMQNFNARTDWRGRPGNAPPIVHECFCR